MRRLIQDVRQRQPQRIAQAISQTDAQAQVEVASTKKAAITAVGTAVGADLTETNPFLAAKLELIGERLDALEEPAP